MGELLGAARSRNGHEFPMGTAENSSGSVTDITELDGIA